MTWAAGYELGRDPTDIDEWVDQVTRLWGTGELVASYAPSRKDDERFLEWAARQERHTCSPGMAAASLRWAMRYDVRDLLPTVHTPTLVVHRADDLGVPVEHGRYLAAGSPMPRTPSSRARTTPSSSETRTR